MPRVEVKMTAWVSVPSTEDEITTDLVSDVIIGRCRDSELDFRIDEVEVVD